MRKLIQLILVVVLFACFQSCQDDENIIDLQDCEVRFAIRESSCSSFTFYNVDQLTIDWQVNGEFIEQGQQFSFDAPGTGTYEICGLFEKPECPLEMITCDTLIIGTDCFIENSCELNLAATPNSCSVYEFNNSLLTAIDWTLNGDSISNGTNYLFEAQEAGTYQICGTYQSEECPDVVEACETIEIIASCFDSSQCENELSVTENSCSSFSFGNAMQTELEWSVNDALVSTGIDFDFEATEAGTYEICGIFETVDCPSGVEVCETIVVEASCFESADCENELSVTENSCSSFSFGNTMQTELEWSVNDALVSTGIDFNFEATEAGTYEICGIFETVDCPSGVEVCETIVIEASCFESTECQNELTTIENSCSSFSFSNTMQKDLGWSVNGAFTSTSVDFDFDATEAGTYEICGYFENSECQMGVQACDTITIEASCFSATDCENEIAMTPASCSAFTFTNLLQNQIGWTVNGSLVETNDVFNFETTEAGSYEICGMFDSERCPVGTQDCRTIEITEECFDDGQCDAMLETIEMSCSFYIVINLSNLNLVWSVNGEFASTGTSYDFVATEPGTYEICGLFETPDCPNGVTDCVVIEVGQDCF